MPGALFFTIVAGENRFEWNLLGIMVVIFYFILKKGEMIWITLLKSLKN